MKVCVVNHMGRGIEVHRVGCADVERERRRRRLNSDWIADVPENMSVNEAIVRDLNDGFCWEPNSGEPAPWSENDVRVMPCVGSER